jgi:hypothetical protein
MNASNEKMAMCGRTFDRHGGGRNSVAHADTRSDRNAKAPWGAGANGTSKSAVGKKAADQAQQPDGLGTTLPDGFTAKSVIAQVAPKENTAAMPGPYTRNQATEESA